MPTAIAVFGAGPGIGQAVAPLRTGRLQHGARRSPPAAGNPSTCSPLDVVSAGARAHVITADLADTDAVPALVEQNRDTVGDVRALYYAPTPRGGFVPAANLTEQRAQDVMPLAIYPLLALVQQFLPHMLEQRAGAILTAQGGSTVHGMPNLA